MRHELARAWEVLAALDPAARTHARERTLQLYRETHAEADARRLVTFE